MNIMDNHKLMQDHSRIGDNFKIPTANLCHGLQVKTEQNTKKIFLASRLCREVKNWRSNLHKGEFHIFSVSFSQLCPEGGPNAYINMVMM